MEGQQLHELHPMAGAGRHQRRWGHERAWDGAPAGKRGRSCGGGISCVSGAQALAVASRFGKGIVS
jgi:hypothetical protein